MEQATCPPTPGEKKEEHVAGCDDETVSVDEERREASEGLPWRRKGPVLVLILLLTLGSNWAAGVRSSVPSAVGGGGALTVVLPFTSPPPRS